MNPIKRFPALADAIRSFVIALACAITICLVPATASAQQAKLYPIITSGVQLAASTNLLTIGTNTSFVGSTNSLYPTGSNLVLQVDEFDNAGLTFLESPSSTSSNSIGGLYIYRSFDNAQTWDPTPYWSFTNTASVSFPVGTNYSFTTNLPIQGVSHLAFTLLNGNAAGYYTNINLRINLKSPKFGAKASTQ